MSDDVISPARAGCFRLLVAFFAAVNLLVMVALLFRLQRGDFGGVDAATETILLLAAACALNLVALVALWLRRWWGLVLLATIALLGAMANFEAGFSVLKVLGGLVPPILLFLVGRPLIRPRA